jgi:glutaryl-CoA transferase
MFGAFAVAGALFRRAVSGVGAHLDLSLLDCQVSLLTYLAQYFWADGQVTTRMGSQHASVVPYGTLVTRDGHLIVAVLEKFWPGFCRAADHVEWERDARFATNLDRVAHRGALMPLLDAAFATRPTEEWLERLRKEGVPAAPILAIDQVLADPQVQYRQMVVEVRHPVLGPLPTLGTPIKVDDARGLDVRPSPALGEHTDEVLTTLLGYPRARIAALRQSGGVA